MKSLCLDTQITEFSYIALAPWPRCYAPGFNLDWIDSMERVEAWLTECVGDRWQWSSSQEQEYWECCVAFRSDRDRTLFLLKWG